MPKKLCPACSEIVAAEGPDMSDEEAHVYALREQKSAPEKLIATPRGKKGGRRAGPSPSSETRKRMKVLSELSHAPMVVEQRMQTRAENAERNTELEVARVYKADHGIGSRRQEVHTERLVYVRPERKVVREATMTSVDHILNQEEQNWLRSWIRKVAVTKEGSKFTKEIVVAVENQFGKKISKPQLRGVLYFMGIQWHRLFPGYYREKAAEAYNVARRSLIVPVLHFLQSRKGVIVRNYDQCHGK
jgi:hypothetical protein